MASSQQVKISLTWTTSNTWAVLYSVYILWPILYFVYFLLNVIVLDEGERGEWKNWLKAQRSKNEDHDIQSHHFMADRWGSNGNSDRLYFWGAPKITADGDCSHEIKRCLLLGRKVMTNVDSMLKSRDVTLPTKVRLVKAMVFPVVMYGCESWTVKKAEGQKVNA